MSLWGESNILNFTNIEMVLLPLTLNHKFKFSTTSTINNVSLASKFKDKDKGIEKFWLVVIMSIFINLNLSSIDNVLFNNYFYLLNKYIFLLIIPVIMSFIYYFFVKNERFLEYEFKESNKGYFTLFILFVIMIILMIMVKPIKH